MSDGRKAARILRRIEEVIILPGDQEVPVDEQGALTKPPFFASSSALRFLAVFQSYGGLTSLLGTVARSS